MRPSFWGTLLVEVRGDVWFQALGASFPAGSAWRLKMLSPQSPSLCCSLNLFSHGGALERLPPKKLREEGLERPADCPTEAWTVRSGKVLGKPKARLPVKLG